MSKKFSHLAVILFASIVFTGMTYSQSRLGLATQLGITKENLQKLLQDPETLNKILKEDISADTKWKFLKDINFNFKTIKSSGDSASTLGFSYAYSKDIKKINLGSDSVSATGLMFSLDSKGNVSFDPAINPADFLSTDASFHFYQNCGGVIPASLEVQKKLNDLQDSLVNIIDKTQLEHSPIWKEFEQLIGKHLSTQYYWDISAVGTFESNQKFTTTQVGYGLQAALDIKAWNPDAILARYNIFDWPFAAIRYLSNVDESFSPKGSTIPTVLFGIQQIVPQAGDPRKIAGTTSSFTRLRGEIAFKTPLGSHGQYKAFFESDLRYYQELQPTAAVETAGLDQYIFFTGAITLSNGFYVSYSTGKLPFDAKKDQIYEIGFQYKL
jgi:hypothetical protein